MNRLLIFTMLSTKSLLIFCKVLVSSDHIFTSNLGNYGTFFNNFSVT